MSGKREQITKPIIASASLVTCGRHSENKTIASRTVWNLKVYVLIGLCVCACTSTRNSKDLNGFSPFDYNISKEVYAGNGAVVSAHALASKVGVAVLKKGGNAIDAAIATQLALAVVYPSAGNLGGGGFMVVRLTSGETAALDYRECAPAASSRNMYLDTSGEPVAGMSTHGPSSSGVPGTVAGLFESLKYATLSFDSLIQPAIFLAETGFAISAREAESLNALQAELNGHNTMPSVFQKAGGWRAGDILVQKDLANTLKRLQRKGKAGFYEGETATLIVNEMNRGQGIISFDDLKSYRAKWRTPHRFSYKDCEVVSMPLPSSGGIQLHQMLKMLEGKPVSHYGALSARSVQLMTEIERRTYADRAQYLGDPDFFDVPVASLTSDEYLRRRMLDYDQLKAGKSANIRPDLLPLKESEETTHISIIDRLGNAVAVTTTLNASYGSRTVVGGAGFFLNDEMDDFSIKPGVPNMYGAIGGEANAIVPGKRMLSSMTPTIVLRNNKPYLVLGTPGGTTIPTSVFQTIVNILEFDLSAKQAVDLPKFHHQWLPDQIDVERSFPDSSRQKLIAMGYRLVERNSIGRMEVISVMPDGRINAVADSRGDDSAEGY